MKALEDQLDALVCAWTAVEYLAGRLEPLGDETAAIWCPPEPRVSAEPPTRRP
jgi:predicted RNase H-like nuclease